MANRKKFTFSGILDYFDGKFTAEELPDKVSEIRQSRMADKNQITAEPVRFDLTQPNAPKGRFYTDLGSAHFEAFCTEGRKKEIVVFLVGARTINRGKSLQKLPFFNRWSFYNYLDSYTLSICDPMYYKYPDCKLGWYLGTETENYRKYTADIIISIAEKLSIPKSNIYIYGSSGGGTAAIEISAFIDGCSVVAINPQLNMADYRLAKVFGNDVGIPFWNYEKLDNNCDPTVTLKNKKNNTFLILSNIRSKDDYVCELNYCSRKLGFTPIYGITKCRNVFSWVYDAEGIPSPHISQDSNIFCNAVLSVVKAIKEGEKLSEINGFVRLMNELWRERFHLMVENKDMKELTQQKQTESPPFSFILEKKGTGNDSVCFNFTNTSCILFVSRLLFNEHQSISATVFLDYWSNKVAIQGSCEGIVIKKEKLSKRITITNNNSFSVSFKALL